MPLNIVGFETFINILRLHYPGVGVGGKTELNRQVIVGLHSRHNEESYGSHFETASRFIYRGG